MYIQEEPDLVIMLLLNNYSAEFLSIIISDYFTQDEDCDLCLWQFLEDLFIVSWLTILEMAYVGLF